MKRSKKRNRWIIGLVPLLIMLLLLVAGSKAEQIKPASTPTELPIKMQMDLYKEKGAYDGVKTWNDGEIETGVFEKNVSPENITPEDANP